MFYNRHQCLKLLRVTITGNPMFPIMKLVYKKGAGHMALCIHRQHGVPRAVRGVLYVADGCTRSVACSYINGLYRAQVWWVRDVHRCQGTPLLPSHTAMCVTYPAVLALFSVSMPWQTDSCSYCYVRRISQILAPFIHYRTHHTHYHALQG